MTIAVIAGLIGLLYLGALACTFVLGLPWNLSLPPVVRLLGVAPIAYGLAMVAWTFDVRGFRATLDSTGATLRKLFRRVRMEDAAGRKEALVIAGPYRIVRHPLYSGVGAFALGVALAADRTFALLGAFALWAWFAVVLAPFEERELRTLFGPDYDLYARGTRRFLPIPHRARP